MSHRHATLARRRRRFAAAVPGAAAPRDGRRLSRFLSLLTLLVMAAAVAGPLASADPIDEIGAGTLVFRTADRQYEAPRLATRVEIAVNGMLARVTVTQQFHNPGVGFVEGLYLFPLPDDAAVDKLSLRIGDRLIVGEIQQKEQARRTYRQARNAGQRASLVEQHQPNLFRTAVANIGPGESVDVEIAYLQTLAYREGSFSLRFPMTVTPRFNPGAPLGASAPEENCCDDEPPPAALYHRPSSPGNRAEVAITLTPGFALSRLESLYHPMEVTGSGPSYQLRAARGAVPMDRDLEIVWAPSPGSEPEVALFTEQWHGETYAMLMLMPPGGAPAATGQPREVVLVIDTSGSMGGISIIQARAALGFALARLGPQDRFNVIRFSDRASAMFRAAMPADPGYLLHAQRFVESLQADGGTNIAAALDLALDPGADARAATDGFLRQVVFITDGSIGNEQALYQRIASEIGSTRLFTVGIGTAPNHWFMRKAARFGRGTFTHIGSSALIEERMGSLLARLESPVMQDIEVIPPVGAVVWPERVQDLYAGEPVVVRARLAGPGGSFEVRGNHAGGPWQRRVELPAASLSMPPGTVGNAQGVAALWGRGQIERLLDTLVTGADPATVRTAVVDLAMRHHLVSRFTSLVAVDRTPARAPGTPLATRNVPLDAPRGSAMLGYPAGATPTALLAIGGVLTLLLAIVAQALLRLRSGAATIARRLDRVDELLPAWRR